MREHAVKPSNLADRTTTRSDGFAPPATTALVRLGEAALHATAAVSFQVSSSKRLA
jgi:hypothetical protein